MNDATPRRRSRCSSTPCASRPRPTSRPCSRGSARRATPASSSPGSARSRRSSSAARSTTPGSSSSSAHVGFARRRRVRRRARRAPSARLRHGRDPRARRRSVRRSRRGARGRRSRQRRRRASRGARHDARLPQPLLGVHADARRPARRCCTSSSTSRPTVFAEVDIYWAQVGGSIPTDARDRARIARRPAAREGRARPTSRRARWSRSATARSTCPVCSRRARARAGTSSSSTAAHRHVRRGRAQLRLPRRQRALARPLVTGDRRSRVAIVGCGVISRTYAHTIRSSASSSSRRASTTLPDRAEELAAKFGAAARHARRGARTTPTIDAS